MANRSTVLLAAVAVAAASTASLLTVQSASPRAARMEQSAAPSYPSDIRADSRSRLPLVKRENLDELGRKLYDKTDADMKSGKSLAGFQGPYGIALYSPRIAEADQLKNDYLRFDSPIGRRLYELAILVTARELDHQFEWSAHEPAALKAGVEQSVIDVVKYRRPVTGLQPKDAAIVEIGRQIVRGQSASSATFAQALKLLGPRDLVDIVSVMGQYSSIAILLNAFDQQLAPGQKPLLPPR